MLKVSKIISYFIIIFFLLLEMLSFSYFLIINKKINSPKNIYNLSEELNKYKDDIENVTECSYKDNLFPHSFLPFIYWNNPKCKGSLQPFNNFGFIGPDFPITNQKKFYDILILGGSVAMQFGPGNCYDNNENHNNNLCIDFLGNELLDYNSIDGRPIKVFNGSAGSYRQPNQLIITHMFGHLFDLIISIEGYNEHQSFRRKDRILDQPSGHFETLNNSFFHDGKIETSIYALNNFIRRLGIKYNFLVNTYSYNFIYSSVKKISRILYNKNIKKENFNNYYKYSIEEIGEIKNEFHKNKFKKYGNYLRSMKNYAELNNGELLVFFQPSLVTEKKILTNNEKKYLKRLNEIELRKSIFLGFQLVHDNLKNENFKIYSLYNLFKDYEEELYDDYVHLNNEGNSLIAKFVTQKLLENNLIKKKN